MGTGTRWLQAVFSAYLDIREKVRRLIAYHSEPRQLSNFGVQVDYTIIVPANNAEKVTGMSALEAIMRQPLWNMTRIIKSKMKTAIGFDAGVEVTEKLQPTLSVQGYVSTTVANFTTTRFVRAVTARSVRGHSVDAVVAIAVILLFWTQTTTSCGSGH